MNPSQHAADHLLGFRPTPWVPRVAVVTGGGRGIGRMTALAFAREGIAVGVLARSDDELDETVALVEETGGTAVAARADVTDEAQLGGALHRLRDALGPIDVLVNNAGVLGPVGPLWEIDLDEWWRAMDVNLRGLLVATKVVLPEMVARRRGRIVNLASQAGVHRWPLVSAYSVSKAAVVKLTENVAREASRFGVSVFSVHPGLRPIGLGDPRVLEEGPADPYFQHIRAWTEHEFAAGRGADPDAAIELLLRVVRGDADPLSGRHLDVYDDLDAMVAEIDTVVGRDLYVLKPERLAEHARRAPSELTRQP